MKNNIQKTKLVAAMSASLLGASMSVSASQCNQINVKANQVIQQMIEESNKKLLEAGFKNTDIRSNTKFQSTLGSINAKVNTMYNECLLAEKAAKKAKKKARDRLVASFVANPIGETIYHVTHSTILEPLGAGGAKNDLNQAVHRILNPFELVVAIGKELDRTKKNLGNIESEIRNGLGNIESDIRNGLGDFESEIRNGLGDFESEIRNNIEDIHASVQNELQRAKDRLDAERKRIENDVKNTLRKVFGL